jgi:hypothetical protein
VYLFVCLLCVSCVCVCVCVWQHLPPKHHMAHEPTVLTSMFTAKNMFLIFIRTYIF